MEEFRFENTVTLSESQYVAIWSVLPTKPWFRNIRLFAITTVGVILLFSTYTVLIGLIFLHCILSLTRLKAEGLYDRVKDLAKRNGKEYNKSTPPRSA